MIDKIKGNPALKRFIIGLITSHKNPRPRLWVKWFVNPFVHKRGRGAIIRRRRSRIDVFPWHRFEVGRDALIEDFTTVNNGAGDVLIGDGTRDSNEQPLDLKEVVIGNESHIGANSVVVAGVHIGERVQVGAGSVVTKDIPSFSVAVGNPARVIKRYDDALGVWVKTRNPQEGIRRQDDNDNSCNSGATEQ